MSDPFHSLHKGRFLELGRINSWEFVRRTKGSTPVGIAALTPSGAMILISQYRVPVGNTCIEIPAGLVGDSDAHADEDWQLAARRELEEETGYTADAFSLLATGPTSAGLTSECIMLVRAHHTRKIGNPTPDGDEHITVHEIPLADIPAFLQAQTTAGHLIDPKVFAALYFVTRASSPHTDRRSVPRSVPNSPSSPPTPPSFGHSSPKTLNPFLISPDDLP